MDQQPNLFSTPVAEPEPKAPVADLELTAETTKEADTTAAEENKPEAQRIVDSTEVGNIIDDLVDSFTQSEKNKAEEQQTTEEKEPEADTATTEKTETAQTDPKEIKRLEDAQHWIGKQSNEIGELRQQIKAYQDVVNGLKGQFAEVQKATAPKQEKPYWEALIEADENAVIQHLKRQNPEDASFDEEEARRDTRTLKEVAKMTKSMIEHYLAPVTGIVNQVQEQKTLAVKEQEFWQGKDTAKLPQMQHVLKQLYPDAASFFDVKSKYNLDPFAVANFAYTVASKLPEKVAQEVTKERDKQITSTRVVNTSAASTPKDLGGNGLKKKMNPIQTALAKEFPELYK